MQWLVDGHNLIGQMPHLQLNDPDDEEKLLAYLRRYRARTGHKVTVIFDPGQTYQPGQKLKQGGITAQFVSPGQSADQALIRRIRKVRNPQAVMVVTSDRAVERAARQAGIRVVSSAEFARQLLALSVPPAAPEERRANIRLSPDEVEEWLAIFSQRRT
ncbi:MAG: NYN domain-containing protein [Anaerolineae bacterium]|nr:NYN domain-containing protein [Anaerolineae bacterium]